MKEQIDEMVELICDNFVNGKCAMDGFVCNRDCEYKDRAEKLYNAGYRKQKEGEWIPTEVLFVELPVCSVCGYECEYEYFNFCPNCGAHMRGGKNE